jgi:hypothetical protein
VAHTFSDDELQQIITYVATRYLEVERGLRSRNALRNLLTDVAFRQLQAAPPVERPAHGPVRQTDLGRLLFQRPTTDRVFVTMPARERGNEWSALVMQLRANREGIWRVTELARVNERTITTRPVPTPATPQQRAVSVANAARDLDVARLALLAVTKQHDRVAHQLRKAAPRTPAERLQVGDLISTTAEPTPTWWLVERLRATPQGRVYVGTAEGGIHAFNRGEKVAVAPLAATDQPETFSALAKQLGDLADQQRIWQRQVTALEVEYTALTRIPTASEIPLANQPPAYLVRVLGMPPEDGEARDIWDRAAGLIEAYRRWSITTQDSPLGPAPADPYQAHNRDITAATLRTLASRVDEARHDQTPAREQEQVERGEHRVLDRGTGR